MADQHSINLFSYGTLRQPEVQMASFGRLLAGSDDVSSEGRFVPTIAQEEYLGAIARWHGVAEGDMSYVMPNWSTWTTGGRAPLGLFA